MFANKQEMKLISNICPTESTYSVIFPVSMGNFIFEHVDFDKLILFFTDNFEKYISSSNSNLKIE